MGTTVAIVGSVLAYIFIATVVGSFAFSVALAERQAKYVAARRAPEEAKIDEGLYIFLGIAWPIAGVFIAGSAVGVKLHEWHTRPDRVKEALRGKP